MWYHHFPPYQFLTLSHLSPSSLDDTVGDLKKLAAVHLGTRPEKLRIQKGHRVFQDHMTLRLYEVVDGMSFELYYD
jgi:ubiquitin-like protein 5